MNILVPLAGKDESFIEEFGELKPFVDIKGRTLIEFVLEALPFDLDRLIFVCLREYDVRFNMASRLAKIFGPSTRVVMANDVTEGSACSALLAEEYINDSEDLLVDLADIYFDPLNIETDFEMKRDKVAGIVPVSRGESQNKPWGYVYPGKDGLVRELREKELSTEDGLSTLGLYYFSRGSDFVAYTRRMVESGGRVPFNNLFYVGPVYNYLIEDGKAVAASDTKIKSILGSVREIRDFLDMA